MKKTTKLSSILCSLCAFAAPAAFSPAVAQTPNDQSQIKDILNETMTSPANETPPSLSDLGNVTVPPLPEDIVDHNKNKTITLGPLRTGPMIQIASLHPVRLEAHYSEPVTLRDVLSYTLRNSLPIHINYQTWVSNHYGVWSAAAGFLPSTTTSWTFTHSNIFNASTEVNSRIFSQNITFPVFQGGRVLYGTMVAKYRERAARNQYNASVNDTLLGAYNAYHNLLLQRALLQIRVKSVEVSQAQLRLNEQLYTAGTGTRFAVMQSRTQLALDKQSLLQQEVTTRLAALQLCFICNMPLSTNLIPSEGTITEAALLDQGMSINDLLNTAIVHRPELREFEYLRLAAARSVQVATAPLYPTASWSITWAHTSTTVTGNRSALGGLASASATSLSNLNSPGFFGSPAVGVTTAGLPVLNGTQLSYLPVLPGTTSLSSPAVTSGTASGSAVVATPTSTSTNATVSSTGLNGNNGTTVSGNNSPVPGGSTTSGSTTSSTVPTSGALGSTLSITGQSPIVPGTGNLSVTPGSSNTTFGTATGATTTGGGGATVVTGGSGVIAGGGSNITGANVSGGAFSTAGTPNFGAFGGKFNSISFSFNLNYTLGNMGAAYAANILGARAAARQAMLQSNAALIQVSQQVRAAYMNALATREQIDVTATGVAAAAEELRLANLRVQMGVGTNLELIQAQRDYIQALINQAQAIISSNQAQAQVLHDTGLISLDTLTSGYRRRM